MRATNAAAGALPNVLIIGAAKCGTTSLHRYLALHPQVEMSRPKELKLFNQKDWRGRLDWYRSHFRSGLPVRGESSPTYTVHPRSAGVPERIREVIPDARLIYLVRDPIERLVAHYIEMVALRFEDRPLPEALADYDSPKNRIVPPSRYAYQLERYRACFPVSQILVLDQLDLLTSRPETLRKVFSFIGVDPSFSTPEFDALHNRREVKRRLTRLGGWLRRHDVLRRVREPSRALPDPVRERLKAFITEPIAEPVLEEHLRSEVAAFLQEDADRLRSYTGRPFPHWSV